MDTFWPSKATRENDLRIAPMDLPNSKIDHYQAEVIGGDKRTSLLPCSYKYSGKTFKCTSIPCVQLQIFGSCAMRDSTWVSWSKR